jgi:FkbM family methyltransferase
VELLRLVYKLKISVKVIQLYKDWLICFLDHFGLQRDKEVICKLKNGIKYKVRTNSGDFYVINGVYIHNLYSRLIGHIEEASVCVDVGAHIGIFSVFAANKAKNVKVYSYEPSPENFTLLKENIRLNNLNKRIYPFMLGICGKRGKRKLFLNGQDFVSCTLFPEQLNKKKHITIECITLKDAFDFNKIERCDFLKMNCEGAECEILFNAPKECLKKIKTITLQYHNNGDAQELAKFLRTNGFNVTLAKSDFLLFAENNLLVRRKNCF